jgi:Flp pilus assembly CpaF family ATPase
MDTSPSFEQQKQGRLLDNFIDDIFPLKKYLDDPAVTDIFTGGSGEIIVKKFAQGKIFTGERVSPSKIRGIILSAAALLDKWLDPVNGIPKLEAVIPPPYNVRITGLLPPWVASPEITLRKPLRIIFPLEDYVEKKRLPKRVTTSYVNLSGSERICLSAAEPGAVNRPSPTRY